MSSEQNNELRANLSFNVEVGRTIELVRWLVTLEGRRLVGIVEGWKETFDSEQSDPELLKAMGDIKLQLNDVTHMMDQYENMVAGFLSQSAEQPQPAAPDITVEQLKEKIQELDKFGGFLDKINTQEEQEEEELDEDSEADREV